MPWWMEEVKEALNHLKAGRTDEAVEALTYLVNGDFDGEE